MFLCVSSFIHLFVTTKSRTVNYNRTTLANLGGFGVEWFTPIINVPQSAILGVCNIVSRPKDIGGGVVAFVPYMGLSLTYDHRAVDGGEATRFLKQIAIEIENLEVEF